MQIITINLDEFVCIKSDRFKPVYLWIDQLRRSKNGVDVALKAPKEIAIHREEFIQEINDLEKKLEIINERRAKRSLGHMDF